jgi:hypothetical protein
MVVSDDDEGGAAILSKERPLGPSRYTQSPQHEFVAALWQKDRLLVCC